MPFSFIQLDSRDSLYWFPSSTYLTYGSCVGMSLMLPTSGSPGGPGGCGRECRDLRNWNHLKRSPQDTQTKMSRLVIVMAWGKVHRTCTELTTPLYNVLRSLELQRMISRYRLLNTKPSPLTYLQRPKVLSKTEED